jgi:hypothetical protein
VEAGACVFVCKQGEPGIAAVGMRCQTQQPCCQGVQLMDQHVCLSHMILNTT